MEKMSKNYKILQQTAKIGRILSKVAFVISMIGICGCMVGILSTIMGSGNVLKIGGVTLHELLSDSKGNFVKSMSAMFAVWLILCVGEAVLSRFSEMYFRTVLEEGTPFTLRGAGELRRLGIMTLVIPTGCAVLAEIVQGIIEGFMNVTTNAGMDLHFDNEATVIMGVMFIIGSFLCGYGAEMKENG